ncbi:hypothetical protein H0O00_00145 [Candidatus Micrarchaeota archaeon]|nr:hypothetical protein [Candidatus Micrarchaeota archaeon]
MAGTGKMVKPLSEAELDNALVKRLYTAKYSPDAVKSIMEMTKERNFTFKAGFGIDQQDANLVWRMRHPTRPVTDENVKASLLMGPISSPLAGAVAKKGEAPVHVFRYDVEATVENESKKFTISCEKPITGTQEERRHTLLYGTDNPVLAVEGVKPADLGKALETIHNALMADTNASIHIARVKHPM